MARQPKVQAGLEGGLLMTEVTLCGRCGAPTGAGAMFCHVCGQSLASGGQAPGAPDQPPAQFAPVSPAVPTTTPEFAPPQFAPPQAAPPAFAGPQAAPPAFAPPYAPAVPPPAWSASGGTPAPGQFGPSGTPTAPPWYGSAAPYGAPPAGYGAVSPAGASAARPFGISVLACVEVVIGLIGLYVAIDLFSWANWATSYGDSGEVVVDFVMGAAYFATAIAVFDLARSLWAMQQWAWGRAFRLSLVLIGLILVSVFLWGVEFSNIIGLVAYLSVLVYLDTSSVRKLFGRDPTAVLSGLF
jgi:hypothetical protein